MSAFSTTVFRGWIGQVRTRPALLSEKGREVLPPTDYRCIRVAVKVIIAGEVDHVNVDAIWVQNNNPRVPSECWVNSGEWLTWPIKEQL